MNLLICYSQPAVGVYGIKKSTPISLVYDLNFGEDNRNGLCKRLVPDVYGLKIHRHVLFVQNRNGSLLL